MAWLRNGCGVVTSNFVQATFPYQPDLTAAHAWSYLGRLIEPELRASRAKPANEEMLARIESLLAKIPRERTAVELVQIRAVAAMEVSGSESAMKLLTEWAAGAPGSRLTIDAKAALQRLANSR